MGSAEVNQFLTSLAVDRKVAASTQNQALSAILFLYRRVLECDNLKIDAIRAQRPERIPVVLSVDEVRRVLDCVPNGVWKAMTGLMYGAGMRLMEVCRHSCREYNAAGEYCRSGCSHSWQLRGNARAERSGRCQFQRTARQRWPGPGPSGQRRRSCDYRYQSEAGRRCPVRIHQRPERYRPGRAGADRSGRSAACRRGSSNRRCLHGSVAGGTHRRHNRLHRRDVSG